MADEPRCETCLYWRSQGNTGECHANAPSPVMTCQQIDREQLADDDDEFVVWWPETQRDNFCGDHRPRRQPLRTLTPDEVAAERAKGDGNG